MTIRVDIADEQEKNPIDETLCERLVEAVRRVALDFDFEEGEISIAVLDDQAIREINRNFLQHDWATDVITFPLADEPDRFEGEIVVSRETADRVALEMPWSGDDELLLYVVHGVLHLVGFDDQDAASRRRMKEEEKKYLRLLGIPGAEHHA